MSYSKQIKLDLAEDSELDQRVILWGDLRVAEFLRKWQESEMFGLDLETYGLGERDALDPFKGKIRLIQIGLEEEALVVDVGGFDTQGGDLIEFFSVLKTTLENPRILKIGVNLKFDQVFLLKHLGYKVRGVRDLELMSRVLWAGVGGKSRKFRHSLKAIAERLGLTVDKTEQAEEWGFELTNSKLNYAANDVLLMIPMYNKLMALLKDNDLERNALIECEASPAFAMMEFYGVPVDESKLNEILQEYEDAANVALKPFTQVFPNINPRSPKQVLAAIQSKLGLNITSSADSELQQLKLEWSDSLLLYRSLKTQVDYLTNIKSRIEKGHVRTKFMQIGPAGHGRSTSKEPNLQNPSNPTATWKKMGLRSVREIFVAPPGYRFIVADLSQAHARIATEVSQDRTLLSVYQSGADMHLFTAVQLAVLQDLGPDWTLENLSKWKKDKDHPNHQKVVELRQLAKPAFYGGLNGQGPRTLQQTIHTDKNNPVNISLQDAKNAIEAFRSAYEGLVAFQKKVNRIANSTTTVFDDRPYGEVRGLSGRRLYLPKERYGEQDEVSVKFTDCVAFVWMSTEADIMKIVLSQTLKVIDFFKLDAYICNFPHDEINLIVKEDQAEMLAEKVSTIMDRAMRMFIKTIPVSDNKDFREMICQSWSEK